jgi:hypothetical protein
MAAAFRKFLVLDVATSEPGALKLLHGARRVLSNAKSSVRIDDARDAHRTGNIAGKQRHFRQRQQADVGHASRRVTKAGTADVNGVETGPFHHPPHRSVEHAGHGNAAVADQLAQA